MPPNCPPRRNSRCPLTAASVPDRSPLAGHRPSVGSDGCATDKLPRSDGSAGDSRPHLDKSPWAYIPGCAYPVVSGQRRMWCRSAPRPSFPRTPSELQQCFRLPRRQWQRFAADEAGEAYRADCPLTSPDGRFPPPLTAARVADTPRPGRCRLADYADAPRAGSRSRRRRGPRSIGPGLSRCVIGWRARPETFAARGFSDLRAGFVLRDESSRRQRSRAPHGSGHAAPEHDPGSPALGTQPQPLEIPRSTNWARISEEPAAGTRARGRESASASRLAFGTLLALGAMREPTTYDTITGPGTSRESSARCYRSRPAGGSGATSPVRWPLTPNTWYITGGNRTGQTHHVDRARWASEFRSMPCCSCQVHPRRAHVIPSRFARRASSFGPRENRVQDTAAPGARSVR